MVTEEVILPNISVCVPQKTDLKEHEEQQMTTILNLRRIVPLKLKHKVMNKRRSSVFLNLYLKLKGTYSQAYASCVKPMHRGP